MAGSTHSDTTTRLKRKKPDTDDSVEESSTVSTSTHVAITRSANFWYDDGNIVLQVEETQFRVHRGVLATHSTFFADMFKIPQPNNEPLVEDCQVVCMPDEVEDWEHMLMVMYQPIKTHPLSPNLRTRHLLSMLRLGQKYQFDVIYDEALTRLKSELPSSFDDYQVLIDRIHSEEPCMDDDDDCYAMACCTGDLFKLINTAVELNVGLVLPVAYYLACSKDIQTVLNGWATANGPAIRLARGSQEIVLLGRDRIRKAIMDDICPWVFGKSDISIPSKECKRSQICLQNFADAIKASAYTALQDIDFDLNNLGSDKLCRSCNREVVVSYIAGQANFWDNLPSYFNLPPWDVLKSQ